MSTITIDRRLFSQATPLGVVCQLIFAADAFERHRNSCQRIRIYFGNIRTGSAVYFREGYIEIGDGPMLTVRRMRDEKRVRPIDPEETAKIIRIEYANQKFCPDPLYTHHRFDGRPLGVRHVRRPPAWKDEEAAEEAALEDKRQYRNINVT